MRITVGEPREGGAVDDGARVTSEALAAFTVASICNARTPRRSNRGRRCAAGVGRHTKPNAGPFAVELEREILVAPDGHLFPESLKDSYDVSDAPILVVDGLEMISAIENVHGFPRGQG